MTFAYAPAAQLGMLDGPPESLAKALQETLDRQVSRLRLPGIQASVRVGRFTGPGASHHHSNTNYVLLGLLSERATGKPVVQLYRKLT